MTRHSEKGMVMTMSTMERKVRTMAAKPGPSGSAGIEKKKNQILFGKTAFLHRTCSNFASGT